MNICQSDLDCPLMLSAGRLGRSKDAFDKRDTLRRHAATVALKSSPVADLAAARAALSAIVAEVHNAPSHLAFQVYPLAMQAAALFESMIEARAALYARIDQARAA